MKRTKTYFLLLLAVFLLPAISLNAQTYFEDTVWTKKTDQASGFYQVKFSNNDSIIVGNGIEMTLFFDAISGEEIIRIPGNNEVFFLANDTKFIRADEPRTKYEIFDAQTYQVIDSLENDGVKSTGSIDVSSDEKYLITNIPNGFRIFDLETKKILRTRVFPDEPNLIYSVIDYAFFVCDDRNFVVHRVRTYEDPEHPGDERYYTTYGDYNLHDFTTLDSIDTFQNSRGMKRSNNCLYYTNATGDPTFGVEIYDFNTKQLMHKLPVNGPSLTGIEFSPDDKYVVTSNGPGQNSLIVWNVMTGEEQYKYTETSFSNFDISNDGKNLFFTVGRRIKMLVTRFGNTSTPEENDNTSLLYPNPTTGEVNINNVMLSGAKHPEIKVFDILGIEHPATAWHPSEEGNLKIDVSSLSPGVYFVRVGGNMYKFIKM